MVKAIAEDAAKTEVVPASEAYKTWLLAKSNIWQTVSMFSYGASIPLILPAILGWKANQWSRQALIKALNEDVMASEKEELTQ